MVSVDTLYAYLGLDLVEDLIQLDAGTFVPMFQFFPKGLFNRCRDEILDLRSILGACVAGRSTNAGFNPSKERRVGNGPGPSRGAGSDRSDRDSKGHIAGITSGKHRAVVDDEGRSLQLLLLLLLNRREPTNDIVIVRALGLYQIVGGSQELVIGYRGWDAAAAMQTEQR